MTLLQVKLAQAVAANILTSDEAQCVQECFEFHDKLELDGEGIDVDLVDTFYSLMGEVA